VGGYPGKAVREPACAGVGISRASSKSDKRNTASHIAMERHHDPSNVNEEARRNLSINFWLNSIQGD
jgi:hypothetical protein